MKQKRFMNSRKGQITIFIIIGIILLFSTATVLYIKNTMTEKRMEDIVSEIQDVPVQVQPVRNFVDGCVASISKQAIKLIGMHGGYVDIPCTSDSGSINYTDGVTFGCDIMGLQPTAHEAVKIWPGRGEGFEDYYIPYWLYMSSPNDKDNYEFKWAKPTLSFADGQESTSKMGTLSIQEQIELYVENNIDDCLANFARFSEQGFKIVPQGEPEAFVLIAEDDVVVALQYDLDIEDGDGDEYEVSKFRIVHDVQLKRIYEASMALLEKVTDSKMFEKTVMNIVAAAGDIKGDIPPAAGMELNFYPSGMWVKTEVQQKLQFYLQSYIPMIRVFGARDSPMFPVERLYDEASLYNEIFMAGSVPGIDEELSISFQYFQDWPIYLYICKGEVISTSDELTFPLFLKALGGIFEYTTPYDVSFPVRIQISEPDAFKGQGFTFNFLYEANLRDNVAVTPDFNATYTSIGAVETMMCYRDHRTSANVTIEVTDTTGRPLDKTSISFEAKEICLIGATELNEMGTKATYKGQFPVAVGNLIVSRIGYLDKKVSLITSLTNEKLVKVELVKKKKYPKGGLNARVYNINKRELKYTDEYMYNSEGDWEKRDSGIWKVQDMNRLKSDCRQEEENNPLRWVSGADDFHDSDEVNLMNFWYYDTNSPPEGLEPNETLIITLQRKKEHFFDTDFNPVIIIEAGKPSPPVELVPGDYTAQFFLLRKSQVNVPECKDCIDLSGCDWKTMSGMEFASFPEAEYTINLTLTPGMLYGSRGLEFAVFRFNLFDVNESQRTSMDIEMMGKMKEHIAEGVYTNPYTLRSTDFNLLLLPRMFAIPPCPTDGSEEMIPCMSDEVSIY